MIMKKFMYCIAFFSIISYLVIINDTINYKKTEWFNSTPTIISINNNQAQICFSVTEPSTIYWRLYTNKNQIPTNTHEFTNTNTIIDAFRFGGNITRGNKSSYTNNITNLISGQEYFLSSIAVNYIGTFPTKIKNIQFKTP